MLLPGLQPAETHSSAQLRGGVMAMFHKEANNGAQKATTSNLRGEMAPERSVGFVAEKSLGVSPSRGPILRRPAQTHIEPEL